MKLLLKDYLASLRERDELDAVVPDLLSEMGFHVYSRPSIGTRQYGVDMAAVGSDDDGVEKVFLFSIKAGNLTRTDWNSTLQSLRPSLDEIKDHYIATRIPAKYKALPVVICVCFGGDMDENVRPLWEGYVGSNKTAGLEYQEWNGDKLAQLLLSGVLREEILPTNARSLFRKSLAMLDEPDAAFAYFARLTEILLSNVSGKKAVTAARQLNICLWVLNVWARDTENSEAPYRASAHALLHVWTLAAPMLGKKSAQAKAMREAADHLIRLFLRTSHTFAIEKVLPHCGERHALSVAVRSMESVDVNLKMFDVRGRLELPGLWLLNLAQLRKADAAAEVAPISEGIVSLVGSNPILLTPLRDEQAIDINLACILLCATGYSSFVRTWIGQIVAASSFAIQSSGKYPCVIHEYADLLVHPNKESEEYFKEATAASVLYPTLAIWAGILGDQALSAAMSTVAREQLPHCSMQLWFPSKESEPNLYTNDAPHGAALTGLNLQGPPSKLMDIIFKEIADSPDFQNLSAVRFGFWAIVLTACRHFRYPLPPQFWLSFLPQAETAATVEGDKLRGKPAAA